MGVMNPTCWMCQSKDKRPWAQGLLIGKKRQKNSNRGCLMTALGALPFCQYLFALSVETKVFAGGGGGLGMESFNWCTVYCSFYGSKGDKHRVQLELVRCHCNTVRLNTTASSSNWGIPVPALKTGWWAWWVTEPGTWRDLKIPGQCNVFNLLSRWKNCRGQKGRGRQSTH